MAQTFQDLAVRYIVDLIRDFELPVFQAAAIVGNGGTESGGFTQIQEINPTAGRGGLGHFQWTGPRRRDFEAWLARNADKNYTPDLYEANYSMLYRELVGPEKASIAALKQTSTLEEATEVFMDKFERPGVPHLDNRISWAKKAAAAFQASGIDPASLLAPKHAPGTTEVLPRAPTLPDLNQILAVALPLLLQALANRQAPGGPATTQPQPDIAALLAQLFAPPKAPAPPVPPPPPPAPVVVETKSEPKTSVGVGLLGLLGSIIGMTTGAVGTPFGMGEVPTTAGTLSVVIPAAISMIGATGIFGPFGAILGRIAGAAFSAAKAPKA